MISNLSKSGLDVVVGRMLKIGDVLVVIFENFSVVDMFSFDNVKVRF